MTDGRLMIFHLIRFYFNYSPQAARDRLFVSPSCLSLQSAQLCRQPDHVDGVHLVRVAKVHKEHLHTLTLLRFNLQQERLSNTRQPALNIIECGRLYHCLITVEDNDANPTRMGIRTEVNTEYSHQHV